MRDELNVPEMDKLLVKLAETSHFPRGRSLKLIRTSWTNSIPARQTIEMMINCLFIRYLLYSHKTVEPDRSFAVISLFCQIQFDFLRLR